MRCRKWFPPCPEAKRIYRDPILFNSISNRVACNLSHETRTAVKEKSLQKVTKAEYEALAAFRYSLRQFLHFSEEGARAAGLTPQQHQALLAIKGFPGRDQITISELSERLQIRHHSAVELAGRLVAERLARRKTDQRDNRVVCLALTTRGEQLLEALSATHREELRRVAPQLELLLESLRGFSESPAAKGALSAKIPFNPK